MNTTLNNTVFPTIKPACQVAGCKRSAMIVNTNKSTGRIYYRRRADTGYVCAQHHKELTGRSRGMTATEWTNSFHPYRQHRAAYCENRDGRLGYKCRCTIRISAQLQVDHIDGDPTNNKPENLQTLCANCHIYKTHANKDYATPGRKALKLVKPAGVRAQGREREARRGSADFSHRKPNV
jgi:hypothetical protein